MATRAGDTAGTMDGIYRTQRHFYDLTRKYYLLGRDRLVRQLVVPSGGSVLEIGCGTGRNLLLAARAYPSARCWGLDISSAMLETASANIARARQGDRIRLAQADAAAFDAQALFGVAAFDRIMMPYTLSMIPPWRAAIGAAADALAPGGELHIVDFGQQEGLPRAFRRLLLAWLRRFQVTPRADLHAALAAIAADRGFTLTFTPIYRGYAWAAKMTHSR